jgi:hypothetical protein
MSHTRNHQFLNMLWGLHLIFDNVQSVGKPANKGYAGISRAAVDLDRYELFSAPELYPLSWPLSFTPVPITSASALS